MSHKEINNKRGDEHIAKIKAKQHSSIKLQHYVLNLVASGSTWKDIKAQFITLEEYTREPLESGASFQERVRHAEQSLLTANIDTMFNASSVASSFSMEDTMKVR